MFVDKMEGDVDVGGWEVFVKVDHLKVVRVGGGESEQLLVQLLLEHVD